MIQELLYSAKSGDEKAVSRLLDMCRPLLIKESLIDGSFDEDLFQELHEVFIKAIETFKI